MEIKPDHSGDYINVPASAITRVNITHDTNSKSAPEGAVQVTGQRSKTNQISGNNQVLILSTYEDENGDPCSAV